MQNKIFLQRLGAYFIDFIVVTLITSSLINLTFINPKYDEYLKVSQDYNETLKKYTQEEITLEEFQELTKTASYELNKNGYVYLIGDIIIYILYYAVFAWTTHGQTLGKKIFKIKIVSTKDKPVKFYQYLIRTIILYSLIFETINLGALLAKKSIYLTITNISSNLSMIISILIFLMILFYKEGRGLHDIISQTKVVSINNN